MRPQPRILSALFVALAAVPASLSQEPAATETGEKPFGSFDGTNVESVNLENGQLVLHTPLYSLPERGQLALSFSITYQDLVYAFNETCAPLGGDCRFSLRPNPGTTYGVQITLDQGVQKVTGTDTQITSTLYAEAYALTDMQDTAHNLGYNGSYYQAVDGSGWAFIPQSSGVPPYYPNGSGGIGVPFQLSSGTVIDSSGNHYSLTSARSNENTIGSVGQITDVDGNYLSIGSSSITDTLDRTIPFPSAAPSTSISSCPAINAPYQTLSSAVKWSLPVYQGTANYIICYASMHVSVSDFAEYSANETVIQSIVRPDGTYWGFIYAAANPNNPSSTGSGDLTQLIFPTGGSVNYTWEEFTPYCTSPEGNPDSSGGQTTLLPDAVATRTQTSNGVNNEWTYTYADTQQYPTTTVTDPIGDNTVHAFSVFSNSKCSLYETNTQYQQLVSGTLSTVKTEATSYESVVNQDPTALPVAYPTQVTTTWPNGQSYSSTQTWDSGVNYLTYWCQPTGTTWSCYVNYEEQVPLGKVISQSTYDYSGSLLNQTQTQYLWQSNNNYLTANLLNTPSSVTVTGGAGTGPTVQTLYTYDESSKVRLSPQQSVSTQIGAPPNSVYGHLTTTTKALNTGGSNPALSTYWLNTSEIDHTVDANQNTTSFVYSSTYDGAYLTQSTNAKGQSTSLSYDFNSGLKTGVTDPNNQPTAYSDDLLDRPTSVSFPDGGSTTIQYNPSGYPQNSVLTQVLMCNGGSNCSPEESSGQTESTLDVYDGLGRPVESALLSDPTGQPDYTMTTYDALGRVESVTNPYRTLSDPTYGITTFSYDMLGRKTMQVNQDSSTEQWCYDGIATNGQTNCHTLGSGLAGAWVDYADENGNDWQRSSDALGRLTGVIEPGSLLTNYSYDALGDLLSVNQKGVSGTDTPRVRSFSYDSLSRLIQAYNPESGWVCYGTTPSNAPANGSNCTPSYDGDGNLTARTDERGIKTSYAYDTLNRLTSKSYSDGTTPTSLFVYDTENITFGSSHYTTTNVVGRLSVICADIPGACQSMTAYSYDAMGRITETLNGTPLNQSNSTVYTVSSTHDLAGNRTSLTNSASRTFNFGYDSAGRLQTASHTVSLGGQPATTTPMISSVSYFPSGQPNTQTTNTGSATVTGTWGLDNRLRVVSYTNLSTANSSNTNYGYSLAYTLNSNVHTSSETAYQSGVGPESWSWTNNYDALNRLVNATSAGMIHYGCAETYDSFGNRTNQIPYGGSGYSCTSPSTPVGSNNQLSGPVYQYDLAGDMLYDGTNTLTYDGEGRIASSSHPGETTTYLYGADGQRVSKISGGGETDYVRDFDGSLLVTYVGGSYLTQPQEIWVGGNHFGTVTVATGNTSQTQNFSLTNWLGSGAARTSVTTGIPSSAFLSQPFGDAQTTLFGTDNDDIHFTGKERDAESGNDYFGARYYASSIGRFMSPDDGIDQDFYDPQSWNLYSYVRNNPLGSVDADGHQVTVCTNVTNADGSTSQSCSAPISDAAYAAGVAAQQAQNANNPPYSGIQAPGGSQPNGNITDNGQVVGTATWSPNPTPDEGAVIPGDMGLSFVAGGMATDFVVGKVAGAIGSMLGRGAGDVVAAAGGASKTLLTDGTKQAAKDIVDALADGTQKASAKRMLNAIQPGQEISITVRSDGTLLISATRPGFDGFQIMTKAIPTEGKSFTLQTGVNSSGEITHLDPK